MKSIKKLIIASALSMMAAGCYAGSLIPGTMQESSAELNFSAPQQISVSFTPSSHLISGDVKSNVDLADITVSSPSIKEFGIAPDFKTPEITDESWVVPGKNTGDPIVVRFLGKSSGAPITKVNNDGHVWSIYNINEGITIALAQDQQVKADTYPVTVNIAGYQS
ncbi:hypothetical protein B6107_18885 [Salmonella enterica]|nr:hypothetical protein [Salmonella enterica]